MTREDLALAIRSIVQKVAEAERQGGGFRLYFETAERELFALVDPSRVESIHRIDRLRIDRGDMVRVGGDIECSVCGFAYYDHPQIAGASFLKRACDGRLIKT